MTLIALVGILPYMALQLKAIAGRLAVLTTGSGHAGAWWRDGGATAPSSRWRWPGFTVAFGTRHLDASERHEGMVAAVAFESVVKLLAFLAVGAFVCWGLFDGPATSSRAPAAVPGRRALTGPGRRPKFAGGQWPR